MIRLHLCGDNRKGYCVSLPVTVNYYVKQTVWASISIHTCRSMTVYSLRVELSRTIVIIVDHSPKSWADAVNGLKIVLKPYEYTW